jgi:hypothetical protein
MTVLLYATIWTALALFVVGAAGRRPTLWLTGAVLCWVHIAIAMGVGYHWSHEAAVAATARQTAAVYGLDWGGGLYVNYVFAGVWLAEAVWRLVSPRAWSARPRIVSWTLGLFYAVILINAAFVFASPAGRLAGVALLGVGGRSLSARKKAPGSVRSHA